MINGKALIKVIDKTIYLILLVNKEEVDNGQAGSEQDTNLLFH